VLYGDGAVGGVINIVTKSASAQAGVRVESVFGSYGYREGRASAGGTSGPWSVSMFGNAAHLDGYRQSSQLDQGDFIGTLKYRTLGWNGYLTVMADTQRQGFPAGLPNLPIVYPITLATPRLSTTPLDWGHKQDINVTGGFTDTLTSGVDLIVDGGIRRKFQQSLFYNYFNNPAFTWDPSTAVPMNFVDSVVTTTSFTPRLDVSHRLFGVANRLLTGIDIYRTDYDSDRSQDEGLPPIHVYSITQTTAAFYAMNTASITPAFDLSYGGRLQNNLIRGTDAYDAKADPNAGFYASNPQAPPVDRSEWQWAAHLGYEYRVAPSFALFGRIARAFRLPNADERVGAGNPFGPTTPANLDLKTQTSYDVEQGFRVKWDRFTFESTAYAMQLKNEIHFIPALFVDVNLDPTRRIGWENTATYRLSDNVMLRGTVAYTDARFRDGPFAGNEVPLVSRWSGSAGLSWSIAGKALALDVTGRYFGERRMDNDQTNTQPTIPGTATMDVKIGGEYRNLFWSFTVQNLFNAEYYDYAIASATTPGYFTAYPQPGRTFLLRAGATF
jgi:iron complex outermembrane receptor protein